ncbi:histidine phosphatase family protein, partial [Oenococcus oeni]
RAIPRFLAPSILKSSQRGKFAPEPDFCLSSPYKRTIETILPLVKQLNLDLHTDPRLKERIRGKVNDNYQELLKKTLG